MRYHEDFEKNKGSFTPTTSDPVTERVKRNTQDFSDISYRGIQRRVVEMERRRALEHDQETITGALATPPAARSRLFWSSLLLTVTFALRSPRVAHQPRLGVRLRPRRGQHPVQEPAHDVG